MKDVAMFSVKIPGEMAAELREALTQKLVDEGDISPKLRDKYEELWNTLTQVMIADDLISAATTLYEDDEIALFEHPTKGDTAPVMGLHKHSGVFLANTGFWDVGNPDEIREELRAAARI